MPISDAAVKAFYDELVADGALAPAERESLLTIMEKSEGKFKSGVLAQRDYQSKLDQQRNDANRLKQEYQEKLDAVAGLQEELKGGNVSKSEYDTLQAQLATERAALKSVQNEYLSVVQKVRETYTNPDQIFKDIGLNPAGVVVPKPGETITSTADPKKPDIDLSNYIDRTTGNQMMGNVLDLMFEIPDFQQEYFDLTGQRLSTREAWAKLQANAASRQPLDPKEFLRKEYKFDDLRAEKQRADIAAQIKKGIEEGLAAERSKMLAAAATDQSPISHLFGEEVKTQSQPADALPGTGEMYKDAEQSALAELNKIRSADQHVM